FTDNTWVRNYDADLFLSRSAAHSSIGKSNLRPWGVLLNQFKMVCERPPRSLRSRLPLYEGEINACNMRAYSPPPGGGEPAKAAGVPSPTVWNWVGQPARQSLRSPGASVAVVMILVVLVGVR